MNFQRSTANPKPPVNLHIERLVVDASLLSAGKGKTLHAAVETELARLVCEEGLTQRSSTVLQSLQARNIQVAEQPRPTRLGQQIAQAVYAALGSENSPPITRQSDGGLR